jgi:hypothetical protein
MVTRSPRVCFVTRQSVPSGRSRTSSLKNGPTVEKGVRSVTGQIPNPKSQIPNTKLTKQIEAHDESVVDLVGLIFVPSGPFVPFVFSNSERRSLSAAQYEIETEGE